MPFISYAQSFEDVTLWRTLKLFGPGFYIDVGANHPTHDSVTRSLYERGWRGINIEPVLHYHKSLCMERPEDINLCVAVGREEGELVFFESTETGLSTLSPEMAELQKSSGIPFVERMVKTRTLSSVCEEHVSGDIPLHFLKIDVEGFEEQVLRGMDFRRWRPWVILLESAFNVEPAWQPLLIDAGYQFALCDGINRYYVAEERLGLLAPLSVPPSILDDFRLCQGHALSHPVADVQVVSEHFHVATQRADVAEAKLAAIYSSRLWKVAKIITSVKRLWLK